MKPTYFLASSVLLALLAAGSLAQTTDPAPHVTMSQLMAMWVQDGQIHLRVPDRDHRLVTAETVAVEGLAGDTVIHSGGSNPQFSFSRSQGEGPNRTVLNAGVTLGQFNIYRAVLAKNVPSETVAFIQSMNSPLGTPDAKSPRVRLLVKSAADVKPTVYESKTLAQLCVDHPKEVQQYLVPLFQECQFSGVFFLSRGDALRVWAPKMTATPAMKEKLDVLIRGINDDDASIRAAANAQLTAAGTEIAPAVCAVDLSRQPVQVKLVLKRFLSQFLEADSDPSASLLSNEHFLLLSLAMDDPQIPALAKAQLEALRKAPLKWDLTSPPAERRMGVWKMQLESWAGK